MEEKGARINAKAVVISAIIAAVALLIGTFGGIWYQSTKTQSVQVDLQKFEVELSVKQDEVDQLTQDKQELQTDNTALEQKVAELESQLGIVQGEQDSAKESSEQLQQQYDELKKQYSEITAQNNAIKVQLDNMGIDIPQTKDSPEDDSTLESDSVWVCNLEWLDKSGDWDFGKVTKGNTGIEYSHSINNTYSQYYDFDAYNNTQYIIYKLYGQYTKITGYLYQEFGYRTANGDISLRVYSDDNSLLNKEPITVTRGSDPIYFEVDVTGVDNLRIELVGSIGHASLGEVALWK